MEKQRFGWGGGDKHFEEKMGELSTVMGKAREYFGESPGFTKKRQLELMKESNSTFFFLAI